MNIRYYLFAVVMTALLALSGVVTAKSQQFTPEQVQQIQKIMHDYLVTKPEVLIEASQALQEKRMQAAAKQSKNAIVKYADDIFNAKGKPVAGNPNGDITLVEYFDYQCPHCKVMGPIIAKLIKDNSNLKVIFSEWPIFGANSQFAAKAALASMQQNKYYEMHMALTDKGYPLTKKDVLDIAAKLGLDVKKLQADMKEPAITKQLQQNFIMAKNLAMIGTPAFVIGNPGKQKYRYISGQTNQQTLQQAIDAVK